MAELYCPHPCGEAALPASLWRQLLCRELGTDLAYTPMMHARLMSQFPDYREAHLDPHPSERPGVFAQLAGQ